MADPGRSNTPGLEPVVSSKCLQYGVDTLHVAFRSEFPSAVWENLSEIAPQKGERGAFRCERAAFELANQGTKFSLRNADCVLILTNDRYNDFHLKFEAGAMLLRRRGLAETCSIARLVAAEFLRGGWSEERVRRADLFMDVSGVRFLSADEAGFVTRSRSSHKYLPETEVHEGRTSGELVVTGFSFAPGNPMMVRLYDKLAELKKSSGIESQKYRTETGTYRAKGWEGEEVWRLEVQLRSEALRARGIGDMDHLQAGCRQIWDYAFAGERPWLRLVVPGTATRVVRQKIDPRWRRFQENPWERPSKPVELVEGHLGGVSGEQTLGLVESFLGTYHRLPEVELTVTLEELIDLDFKAAAELAKKTIKKSREDALKSRAKVMGRYSKVLMGPTDKLTAEVEEALKKEMELP